MRKKKSETIKSLLTLINVASHPTPTDVDAVRKQVIHYVEIIRKVTPEDYYSIRLKEAVDNIEDFLLDGHTLKSQFDFWILLLYYIIEGKTVRIEGIIRQQLYIEFKVAYDLSARAIDDIYE